MGKAHKPSPSSEPDSKADLFGALNRAVNEPGLKYIRSHKLPTPFSHTGDCVYRPYYATGALAGSPAVCTVVTCGMATPGGVAAAGLLAERGVRVEPRRSRGRVLWTRLVNVVEPGALGGVGSRALRTRPRLRLGLVQRDRPGVIRGTIRLAGGWSRRRGWCAKSAPTSRLFGAYPETYTMQVFGSAFRGANLALRKALSEVWMEYGVRTPQKSREVGARFAHQPRRRDHPPAGGWSLELPLDRPLVVLYNGNPRILSGAVCAALLKEGVSVSAVVEERFLPGEDGDHRGRNASLRAGRRRDR